jgi:cytoskeleton protein RodZ
MADWLRPMGSPAVLAVLALLAAALLIYVWPSAHVAEPAVEIVKPNTASASTSSTSLAASKPLESGSPGKESSDVPAIGASAMMTPLSLTSPTSPAATTEAVARAPTLAQSTGESGSIPIIFFKAKANSWVEVVDARQTVLMRRIVNAGESASASGELPLAVVVGRADAIEVQVRGQAIDLLAKSRENVARFEVK